MNIIKKSKKRQFKGLKIDLIDRVGGSKIYTKEQNAYKAEGKMVDNYINYTNTLFLRQNSHEQTKTGSV